MNLLPFAIFNQKIPDTYLCPIQKKNEHKKNVLSIYIDIVFLFCIYTFITSVMTLGFNAILATLTNKFNIAFPISMHLLTFPLLTCAYYIICLNSFDGMSFGMRMTKKRIDHHSYQEDLIRMAFKLTLTTISLGLTYPWIKNNFRNKDYRYQHLMESNESLIDLHSLIKTNDEDINVRTAA